MAHMAQAYPAEFPRATANAIDVLLCVGDGDRYDRSLKTEARRIEAACDGLRDGYSMEDLTKDIVVQARPFLISCAQYQVEYPPRPLHGLTSGWQRVSESSPPDILGPLLAEAV